MWQTELTAKDRAEMNLEILKLVVKFNDEYPHDYGTMRFDTPNDLTRCCEAFAKFVYET